MREKGKQDERGFFAMLFMPPATKHPSNSRKYDSINFLLTLFQLKSRWEEVWCFSGKLTSLVHSNCEFSWVACLLHHVTSLLFPVSQILRITEINVEITETNWVLQRILLGLLLKIRMKKKIVKQVKKYRTEKWISQGFLHSMNWWWNEYESVPSRIIIFILELTHTHTPVRSEAFKVFIFIVVAFVELKISIHMSEEIFQIHHWDFVWENACFDKVFCTPLKLIDDNIATQQTSQATHCSLLATRPYRFVCWRVVLGLSS